MAFLFRRSQQPAPQQPAPPPPPTATPLESHPQTSVPDRLIQPALSAYVSGNKDPDNATSGSDQIVQKGTLTTVARSIRHCVAGMGPWDISDLTLGLYKIATRHALEGVSDSIDGSVVSNKQELEEILYWMDWSWASYLADEKAIAEFLHTDELQLKKHVNTSAILKPAYCIAVDKAKKCVVLSIRGTYAATDVLTDLQPHSEKFEGGYAHSGILSAARWILENENDNLQILLSENPGYKLVLTGHSLGAGAACLLSYLLRESVGSRNKRISSRLGISSSMIECWGFGCPPCVDRQLCEKASFIKNIVLQDDIVARASIAALEDLRLEILQTNWEDVLEDGGIAKKMLGLVNRTNAALGNFEQALGYNQGTFFQQAKSLGFATLIRATVARPGHGPPGHMGHFGAPMHFGPPGNYGHPRQFGNPGHYGPLGSSGYQDVQNPYGTPSLQPYGGVGPRPQNLTGWISYGASALGSYLGNSNISNAGTARECMEGGRLFVPGILYHIKRTPLETSVATDVNRSMLAEGVNPDSVRQPDGNSNGSTGSAPIPVRHGNSNGSTGSAPIPVRHGIIKALDPNERFMKIVLSKSLLSDHSLFSYKDAIEDAIKWSEDIQ